MPLTEEEASLVEAEKALLDCKRDYFLTKEWAKELERRLGRRLQKMAQKQAKGGGEGGEEGEEAPEDAAEEEEKKAEYVERAHWRVALTNRRADILAKNLPVLREKRLNAFEALHGCVWPERYD